MIIQILGAVDALWDALRAARLEECAVAAVRPRVPSVRGGGGDDLELRIGRGTAGDHGLAGVHPLRAAGRKDLDFAGSNGEFGLAGLGD